MNTYRSSPFASIPPVVKNLIIINVIFFLATYLLPKLPMYEWLAVFYPASPNFKVWQVITYMFMHGGFAHLFFNMFALFTFGSTVEYFMGSKRFLNFYLITGLGALVLQFLVQGLEVYQIVGSFKVSDPIGIDITQEQLKKLSAIYYGPMVGASGAIFGILIAFGMLFPNTEMFIIFFPVPIKAKYLIPLYVVLELFLGVKQFEGDSIAHFAHLGGALFGFILIKLWGLQRPGGYR